MEKRKKRKQFGDSNADNSWKPNADETEVATYLYRKLPAQEARLSGMIVRVFSAEDAVSLLMESPWAASTNSTKKAKPCLFPTRDATVYFLTTLLQKQMFHRGVKVIKPKVSRKKREEVKTTPGKSVSSKKCSQDVKTSSDLSSVTGPIQSEGKTEGDELSSIGGSVDKLTRSSPQSAGDESNKSATSNHVSSKETGTKTSSSSSSSSSSSTKPMKIEISEEQLFVLDDPQTVYVWIYEPPPGLFNWLAGSALLLGIILCCLFPIWPAELRSGAYYLTLLASAVFGLLIAVALIRLVLYLVCWICTLGKYGFWLFPNYFEDCGFFESFRPIYSCTPITADGVETKRSKEKSRSKVTNSGGSSRAEVDQSELAKSSSVTAGRLKASKEEMGKVD